MVSPCGTAQAVALQQCCIPAWRHVRLFSAICPKKNWNPTRFLATYWEITSFGQLVTQEVLRMVSSCINVNLLISTYSCILPQSPTRLSKNWQLGQRQRWDRDTFWSVDIWRRQKGRDPPVQPHFDLSQDQLSFPLNQPLLTSPAKYQVGQLPTICLENPFTCSPLHLQPSFVIQASQQT